MDDLCDPGGTARTSRNKNLSDFRPYRPVAVVAEFERALLRELDFRRELRHLQLFRQAFKDDPSVRFPEPYSQFSDQPRADDGTV